MRKPKVSVVMPVYNEVKNLKKSIESIQKQTFTDWEFIIVNEFVSNDGSDKLIERYAQEDKRIIFIQKTYEKKGIAVSLNMGIKVAKGEYIARMDADDFSYPNRLEKQVEYMDNHLEIGLCGTWCRVVSNKKTWEINCLTNPEEIKANIIFGNQILHPTVMFRRELFIAKGLLYDENYLAEDYELWTRAIENGVKCSNLAEILLDYYWGFGENISSDHKVDASARTIMIKTLKNQLGINGEKYNELLFFHGNTLPQAQHYPTDFVLQGFHLLCEIEEKNCELNVFDKVVLAAILCKRWNWLLENAYYGECFSEKKYFLPKLEIECCKNFKYALFFKMCEAQILKKDKDGELNKSLEKCIELQLVNAITLLKKSKKVIVFGTGEICDIYFTGEGLEKILSQIEIVAFCDNDIRKHNTEKYGKIIISPDKLDEKDFDFIIIASTKYQLEIQKQLINTYQIRQDKIIPVTMLYLLNKC